MNLRGFRVKKGYVRGERVFWRVRGGQNGISGPARPAANYVFRTHSITFTRNDVYPPTLLGVRHTDLSLERSERGPPVGPGPRARIKIAKFRLISDFCYY